MTFRNVAFVALVVGFSLFVGTSSYYIDQGCSALRIKSLQNVVQEAMDMSTYATWRMLQRGNVGALPVQLLGNNAAADFINYMSRFPGAFGQYRGEWTGPNSRDDNELTLIIKCGGNHLVVDPAMPGFWRDPDFPGMRSMQSINTANAAARPCSSSSGEMARTYPTGNSFNVGATEGPRYVIMLCDGYDVAALSKSAALGPRWRTTMWDTVALDRFSTESQTVTMLHEGMHAIWIWPLANRLTGWLAPGVREVYDFDGIRQLPDNQKRLNAHSYTLLGLALWFKRNSITDDGTMGPRIAANSWAALDMPQDPHP